jgi:hypothetical protein
LQKIVYKNPFLKKILDNVFFCLHSKQQFIFSFQDMKEIYMNMKKIILLLAGSALLSSCVIATPSVTPEVSESGARGKEDRPIHQYTGAVGVYRIKLTEPILMSLEGRCDVPLFVIEARKETGKITCVKKQMNSPLQMIVDI